jgi:hypothetical protein
MSNIFENVLQNANTVQDKLLGPTYPYYKNINTPSQIGMTSDGTLSALGNDINGLIQYVEVMVSGNSRASATGGPLGNKFFLQTGAKCQDVASDQQVDRYIYVDNVPVGNIPFISSGLGVNFSEFKGLIPGAMGNLNVLNPFVIMQAFLSGSTPPCQELTMQTIDNNNNSSSETHFVTLVDIQNMDPCIFSNGKNPITGANCKMSFKNMDDESNNLPSDKVARIYYFTLSCVLLYIFYKLTLKTK